MSNKMTARERFKKICSFELKNDPFMWSVDLWNETFDRWVTEGMPVQNTDNKRELNMHLIGPDDQNEGIAPNAIIFGMGKNHNPPWIVALDPMFEPEIISEDEEHTVSIDYDGATVRRRKEGDNTIPQFLEYPVKDKKTWDKYKERLDPFSAGRWPEGWQSINAASLEFPGREDLQGKHFKDRDFPLGMLALSLYGNIRQYMGVENFSIAMYDNMSLIEEIMDWQMYMSMEMLKKVFAEGIYPEWVWIWEDMAFKGGSLVDPSWVKKYMVPRYKKVTELMLDNGIDALILDCDGNCEELMPMWIECGINGLYPFERAANMDPVRLRKQYGKDLLIFGGVDKRALAAGKTEIDKELEIAKELLKFGGYMPNCDHHLTPDISYENIVYFMNELRKLSEWDDDPKFIKPLKK